MLVEGPAVQGAMLGRFDQTMQVRREEDVPDIPGRCRPAASVDDPDQVRATVQHRVGQFDRKAIQPIPWSRSMALSFP
ncbi:hypothetical protein GBZ48_21950 [Azospirillum melinis]|uniref:Uncharacterized protein n=1 Tax=Azospirillum melinis TaxID=328839 RepID=A0ABX2KKY4_9PROT|nr:hypothetical protein [Azospirillum melinis]MBP2307471.1 hypothetical protein [Azospirillum melinis]NUB01919.1 hypothetical protein [Azospirillum melinis]